MILKTMAKMSSKNEEPPLAFVGLCLGVVEGVVTHCRFDTWMFSNSPVFSLYLYAIFLLPMWLCFMS